MGKVAGRVVRALRDRLSGPVLDGQAERELYSRDTGIFQVRPIAAVEARTPEDIRAVLEVAGQERVGVTPRAGGSNTGGAAVGEGIVLFFRPGGPLAELGRPEPSNGRVRITAGAGTRHDALQAALAAAGHVLPSDPSSGPLSLVGGNVATRASGPHALRYGAIDRYLVSLRFLTAEGTLVDTADPATIPTALAAAIDGIRRDLLSDARAAERVRARSRLKSSAGYNLAALLDGGDLGRRVTGLLAGSVGTLGIVLDATMEGRPAPHGRAALLVCPRELAGASRLALAYRDLGAAAVEIMNARSVALVRTRLPRAGIPETTANLLLVELDGEDALERATEGAHLARVSGEDLAEDPVIREDPAEIGGLWKARKLMLPLLRGGEERSRALSVVNDVGVPPERLDEAIVALERIFAARRLDAFIYGHAGDGNLHLRPLFDPASPDLKRTILGVAEEVYTCVLGFGGTITGEHGMGRLRAPFLQREWGPALYGVMKRVKDAFDPAGVLNPGAMLPTMDLGQALERYFAG